MFVPKKNGELKIYIDYKKINTVTIKNKYPSPLITNMKTKFKNARYFTILDLRDIFNFIKIKQKNEGKRDLGQNTGYTNIWSCRLD